MISILNNSVFLQRFLQSVLGAITLFFVANYLSVNTQGWYYTFSSIAAIYTIFDLGLSVVLVQLSAHLSNDLKWLDKGCFEGSGSRQFLKLVHQSTRFYLKLALVYLLAVGSLGIVFFVPKITSTNISLAWIFPWITLVFFTSLNLLTLPLISLIEGSGKVNEVYYLRMTQNLIGSLFLWAALISGYQLWALSMLPALGFLVSLIWLMRSKQMLLKAIFSKSELDFQWRDEVWPLQWRVGLSWLAGYLLMQIYTPILFHLDSAKVAGQMGLSLTLANMIGLLAQSWIARKLPDMGKFVANKDWVKFDQIFMHNFKLSLWIYLLGGLLLCFLCMLVNEFSSYGERILPILPFIGLLAVVLVNHINGSLASNLRSYKKEPLVFVSLIATLFTIPLALYGASKFSVNGVVVAILSVQLLFTLPVSIFYWLKFNREWRLD